MWVRAPRSPLILQFLVVLAHQVASDVRLEERDDLGESLVAHVLQHTEHAGAEEHLGVAEAVVIAVELQRRQHLLGHHLAVDEPFRDGVRRQDRVSAESTQ